MSEKSKLIWKILFHITPPILSFLITSAALAQEKDTNILRYPVGSALCIEEKATGFSWKDNRWTHTRFSADQKFIAKKIPLDNYKNSTARVKNNLYLCADPSELNISEKGKAFTGFIEACYEIKIVGEESNAFNSTMCNEYWNEGKLDKVSCTKANAPFFFHPDGLFVKFPWHSNIERDTKYKDSLSVSVGSCSRVD